MNTKRIGTAALVAVLTLLHAPFLWTGHVQEDSYISFRTGFNLADHGVLTFNPGERYASTTSLLYGYLVALIRLGSGSLAVGTILLLDAIAAALAVVLIARSFALTGRALWSFTLLVGMSNGALIASFNGMETPWYLLYIALLTLCLGQAGTTRWLFVALVTLSPLMRPDAFVLAGGAVAGRWLLGSADEKRDALWGVLGLALALPLYVGLNLFHSGTWATPSVMAKQAAYHPDLSLVAIAKRFATVYFGGLVSVLPSTKYLPSPATAGVSIASFALLAFGLVRAKQLLSPQHFLRLAFLACVALLLPLFFVVTGGMFPWYFLPSAFALAACLLASILLLIRDRLRPRLLMLSCAVVAAAAAMQFLLSMNIGRQESGYRASVGRYLAQVSKPGDTLVLEPAGYIPFHSGLITYDEVGLTSPRPLPYLRSGKPGWLVDFLRDTCPTFTVQRGAFAQAYITSAGYSLSRSEREWFQRHYLETKRFIYRPEEWAANALERRLLALGSHADYIVYRRNDALDCRAE